MARGQGKDLAQARGRLGRGHGPARDQAVLGKRRFDVHGKAGPGMARKHHFQDVRAHAVGIDLDVRPKRREFGGKGRQTRGQGRFAAGDDEAVQPFGVGGGEGAHRGRGQGRALGEGQGRVVAVRAAQVAAAEKKHGAKPAGPIAKGHGLDAAHELPGWGKRHFIQQDGMDTV